MSESDSSGDLNILISPDIEEALSKISPIATKRSSLALVLEQDFACLYESLTEIQAVVQDFEKTQESDPAIRSWLQILSDEVRVLKRFLDEVDKEIQNPQTKKHIGFYLAIQDLKETQELDSAIRIWLQKVIEEYASLCFLDDEVGIQNPCFCVFVDLIYRLRKINMAFFGIRVDIDITVGAVRLNQK